MSAAIAIAEPRVSALRHVLGLPVVLASLLVCLTFCFCSMRFSDPDLWWHLKVGQEIWRTHALPNADHWSFTAYGKPWIDHEWLSQLLLYVVWRIGGYQALQFFLCAVSSAIVAMVYVLCRRYCGNAEVAMLGGFLAFFFGTMGFSLRPQLIGYALLVLLLLIVERAWSGRPRALWWLPPLFALWVNCHGSWMLGLGILSAASLCAWIAQRRFRFTGGPDAQLVAGVLGFSMAALLINPVGVRLLAYPLDVFLHQRTNLNFVAEWFPLTMQDVRGVGLFAVLGALLLAALTGRARASAFELTVLLPVALLAIQHMRMVFVFGVVCAPIVCRVVAQMKGSGRPRRDFLPANAFLMLLCSLCCYAAFPSEKKIAANIASHNPVEAVRFIKRSGLPGPMLNDYMWGGYLIWALPEQKVFIDGRGDIYDWSGVLARYRDWYSLDADPERLLNDYGIRFCLLPGSSAQARVMSHLTGWTRVYSDNVAAVFARRH
jgi:hypothetical protein